MEGISTTVRFGQVVGIARNHMCSNFNLVLNVNEQPILVEGVSPADTVTIVGGSQVQSPYGLPTLVLAAQQKEEEENKSNDGLGGLPPGGGSGDDDPIKKLLQEIMDRASKRYDKLIDEGVAARTAGVKAHSYSKRMIEHIQGMFGELMDVHPEQNYLNKEPINYNARNSVRLDVVVGDLSNPRAVYDYKFGGAVLSETRIERIYKVTGFSSFVPVAEIRPIRGAY